MRLVYQASVVAAVLACGPACASALEWNTNPREAVGDWCLMGDVGRFSYYEKSEGDCPVDKAVRVTAHAVSGHEYGCRVRTTRVAGTAVVNRDGTTVPIFEVRYRCQAENSELDVTQRVRSDRRGIQVETVRRVVVRPR